MDGCREVVAGEGGGGAGAYIRAVAVTMSLFHVYTAATLPYDALIQRGVHLLFVLAFVFLVHPLRGKEPRAEDWLVTLAGVGTTAYLVWNAEAVRAQAGLPYPYQVWLGWLMLILILEATRRTAGWSLPILVGAFLIYAHWGNYFPYEWGHPGLSWERILGYLYLTTDGIWSIPLGVSSTVLISFMIFGAFLEQAKVSDFFRDFSVAVAGRMIGGPAQVAVISSALVGTITGSSTANVATTGAFTIPLMKSRGYRPEFAAGVEAAASTGAQIMPPVMGAGAFIMADILGIEYGDVAMAAIIPAGLYFLGVFLAVRLEALRLGLGRMEPEESAWKLLVRRGALLLPLAAILYFVLGGHSPSRASFYGLVVCLAVSLLLPESRMGWRGVIRALENGARGVVAIASACACAGIVVGVMAMTGLGVKFTYIILNVSGGSLPLALLFTMISSLVLGLELPTAVAYVIAAAVAGPALAQLGMNPLAAHMFIFFYSILGTITPPVCLSVYVAAGLAEAHWLKTAWVAIRLAIPAFLVPYMFSYNAALLGIGDAKEVTLAAGSAVIGVYFLAVSAFGFQFRRTRLIERIFALMAALLLITPGGVTDSVGLLAGAATTILQLRPRAEKKSQQEENLLRSPNA